jgi:hypothetical protein
MSNTPTPTVPGLIYQTPIQVGITTPMASTPAASPSAAADAQVQLVALAAFFAGVNAGQTPNATQLATASASAGKVQADLIAMGAPAAAGINASGGITPLQAAIGAVVVLALGVAVGHYLLKKK